MGKAGFFLKYDPTAGGDVCHLLQKLGDQVTVIGFTAEDSGEKVVTVNGGPLQKVDGTPFAGECQMKWAPTIYRVVLAVEVVIEPEA